MKRFKLFFMSLIFLLVLLLGFNTKVEAAKGEKYYNDNKSHYYQVTDEVIESQCGVTYTSLTGSTINGYNKKVNLFSMKTDGVTSKLVTWAAQNLNNQYKRMTVRQLAALYEKENPGWKVVAGINGDQFGLGFGTDLGASGTDYYQWQTYYPFFMNGERRFSVAATGAGNGIGFVNNGSKKGFVPTELPSEFRVEILDADGNILSTHPIAAINESAGSGQTSVWFSYINSSNSWEKLEVTSSNDLYVVSNSELAYMNNSDDYTYKPGWNYDHVFGRGTIDQVVNTFTVKAGQFAIDTSDETLKQQLGNDVRVRVQAYFETEALNNVEAAAGYHSVQRKGGKDILVATPSDSYNYGIKERAVFGIKADGTYVLMNVDGVDRPRNGLTGDEINAVLKGYGVVEAYQCDGGGSATAIWRNAEGGWDVVNTPTDTSGGKNVERSVLTALFFVVKDCGVEVNNVTATTDTLTINVNTDNVNTDVVKKLYCTVNGVKKEVIDNTVTFDGLTKMTEYSYSFTYDTSKNKGIDGLVAGTAKTSKTTPILTELKAEVLDGKVIFTPIFEDPDEAFKYIRIVIGEERFPYLDEPIEITVDSGLTKLEYVLTYCYDIKDGNDKVIIEETRTLVLKEDNPTDDPTDNPTDDPTDNPTDDPTDDPTDNPSDKNSGCKKDASMVIISLISLSSLLFIFRKRK